MTTTTKTIKTPDLLPTGELYRLDWFKCSEEHAGTDEQKEAIKAAVLRCEWVEIGERLTLPMMPGEGIKGIIKEFNIPKVRRISYNSHELAPYGLYGIEGNYKNARVLLFFIDEGSEISTLCAYVIEKPA